MWKTAEWGISSKHPKLQQLAPYSSTGQPVSSPFTISAMTGLPTKTSKKTKKTDPIQASIQKRKKKRNLLKLTLFNMRNFK